VDKARASRSRPAAEVPPPAAEVAPGTRIDEVIEAAERLFVRGYRRSSVRDLAAELGIRVSSLYYYFPSKDAILEAIIRRHLDDIRDLARSVVARGTAEGWPFREILRTLIYESVLFLIRDRRAAGNLGYPDTRAARRSAGGPQAAPEGVRVHLHRRDPEGDRGGRVHRDRPVHGRLHHLRRSGPLSAWFDPNGRLTPEEVARIYSTLLTRAIARNPDDPAFRPTEK
jgi:AcrR family transcriptional regulator